MSISIDWPTGVIFVPQADLTFISGVLYELDVNAFRNELKDLEDSEDGSVWPSTHNHNTTVTLSGVTYARTVEIINGYTVEFEDGQYTVRCVGANHNLADVKVPNQASLIIGNSAGLIEVATGSGPTAPSIATAVWERIIDNGLSAEELMQIMVSVLAGKISGAATPTVAIRDLADTKNRVLATVDVNGNRSGVTLDP